MSHPFRQFLSAKERAQYSLSRAIFAADARHKANCLEREVSDTYCRETQVSTSGVMIPPEILFGADPARIRGLAAGTASDGGYTVGHEIGGLIDFLFPQSVIFGLGAKFLGGVAGTLGLPRVTASDEGEWLAEGAAASSSAHSSTVGQVFCSPHRVYAGRTITKQLLAQGAFGDAIASSLVMGAYAAAIDRAALVGTGGVQPLGLVNDANVVATSSGTNGGAPTLAILNSTEGTVIANRVALSAPGWVVSPNTRAKLKNSPKATGTSSYLLESDRSGDIVNGFRGYATAYLSDTLTKGSGTGLGTAVFGGDWTTLAVTQFGGIDLVSDYVTQAPSAKVIVSLNAYLDIAKQRPEAFAKIVDVITT